MSWGHSCGVRSMRIGATLLAIGVVGAVSAAAASTTAVQPLPQSFCSPLFHGRTPPQVLIASDFPVRYFPKRGKTLQLQAAIRYVLARRGYRAGRYAVGYQACDDSSPQQGSGALAKCAANAKAYAQNPNIIGLIGTWSSNCSAAELPILNRASGGPLGLISPSNTNVGLTHAGGGTRPGEPGRYYPTGTRSFVRIISPDDAQAVADALLVKDLGGRRVFVLDDGEEYGLNVPRRFSEGGLGDRPLDRWARPPGPPTRPASTIWSASSTRRVLTPFSSAVSPAPTAANFSRDFAQPCRGRRLSDPTASVTSRASCRRLERRLRECT